MLASWQQTTVLMSCPSQRGPSVFTKKREERKCVSFPNRKIQPYTFWIPISIIKLWVHKTRTFLRRHINQIKRKLWFVRTNFSIHYLSFLLLHFPPVIPDVIVLRPSYRPLWITSLLPLYWPLMWKGECPPLVWCSAMFVVFWARESVWAEFCCLHCLFCSEVTIWADFSQYAACSISTNSPKIIKGQVNFSRHQEKYYLQILAILYKLLLPTAFCQLRVSTLLWCSSQMDPTALCVAP